MIALRYALMFGLGVYQGVLLTDWWHTKKTLRLLINKRDLINQKKAGSI